MDNAVEVRYAGVVVGRGALREVRAGDADGVFVAVPDPLPVGTLLTLKIGDAVREGRVEDIVESSDANAVGMRVRWGAAAPAAKPVAPSPAPAADSAPAPQAAAPASSADSEPTGDSGPTPVTADAGEESGAIPAPLSLAGQGGKRRRKRR
ncbi:MAG TPA: hypothetical protein VHK47_18505 [Polyangia bacterium]|nr:hypothetical protein [Polyangia bacterium]